MYMFFIELDGVVVLCEVLDEMYFVFVEDCVCFLLFEL